jgi:hypothetical protein
MVADPARHALVLFGGRGVNGELDDTWTWDGATWARQNPPQSPPAQEDVQFLYDGTRQRVLLIGGSVPVGSAPAEGHRWSRRGGTPPTMPAPTDPVVLRGVGATLRPRPAPPT